MMMSLQKLWIWLVAALLVTFAVACGGGGGKSLTPITPSQGTGGDGQPPEGQQAFSVVLTAQPDQGPAPMTVSFSAYAFGGYPSYSYEWDFNGDGVADSNAVDPYWTFNNSAVVTLNVSDSRRQTVTVKKSVTVTAPIGPGGTGTQPLVVRFQTSVNAGSAPLRVQFNALVSGGSPPYGFLWDFDGDGIVDSNSENPVYTYTQPGSGGTEGQYLFFPVLTVVDNRGIEVSTADDNDGDLQPDWHIAISVTPPSTLSAYASVNPPSGQAPLPCVFNGGASGGEAPYQFEWNFGDGTSRSFDTSAVAQHTYTAAGTYYARMTVRDNQGVTETSGVVPVYVSQEATFSVRIEADATEGPVPFNVQFTSFIEGGKEPVHYNWEVFTDLLPGADEPVVVLPPEYPTPMLDRDAVIVPTRTSEPNPVITFATYRGQTVGGSSVGAPYAVRLVATDDNGVQAVSNLIRIMPRPPEPASLYRAERTPVTGWSIYGGLRVSSLRGFAPRANPATVTHPSGMVDMFGGDKYSDTGEFRGIVDLAESSWCLNMSGTNRPASGLFGSDTGQAYANGGLTLLNSFQGLPYAYVGQTPTVKTPPPLGTAYPAYMRPNRTIQRSDPFVPRGSAAAAMVHEDWDINPGGFGACPG